MLAGAAQPAGLLPDLTDYAYTGDKRAPVRQSRLHRTGLFPYISFAVYGGTG